MTKTLGDYYKNNPSDCYGRSFEGYFTRCLALVELEYIALETILNGYFQAVFEYKGHRYRKIVPFIEHLNDKEIPVSKKSRKTLEREVAQPTLCTGD